MAGQVVDAGACRAGGVALLRVDVAFGPIGENVKAKQRHAALAPSKDRACALYAADKSLDRQGLLSTNRREDTALVITTPRSSTRSFTDDLAPGLSTKDRAHWDRGLDPGPERQHARSCQGPKARSRTIDRTEHQVHRRFQAGF